MATTDKKEFTDLRATAPAALEDGSDTTWAAFQALQSGGQDAFAPTRPSTMPGGLHPLSEAEAGTPPAGTTAPSAAARPSASLDAVLALARKSNRVCPQPPHWKKLSELLQQLAPPGTIPPFPIEGAAWNIVPPMQKRLRLREQLEWAARHGALQPASELLEALGEKDWLHF